LEFEAVGFVGEFELENGAELEGEEVGFGFGLKDVVDFEGFGGVFGKSGMIEGLKAGMGGAFAERVAVFFVQGAGKFE
jgi:hypothetical protein